MKNSEVLETILNKITAIETILKLNEYQQKLIVKKLNALTAEKQANLPIQAPAPAGPGKVIAPDMNVEDTNKKLDEDKKKLMSVIRSKDAVKDSADTNNVDSNSNNNIAQVPVTQRLTNKAGKSIPSANIVIKNVDGEIIRKTQTNTTGRWQAILPFGKYIVEVNGKSGKEVISFSHTFEVVSSKTPITLPMPEMYKVYTEE